MSDLDNFYDKAGTSVSSRSKRHHDGAEVAPSSRVSTLNENNVRFDDGAATVDGAQPKRRWSASDDIFWAAKASYDKLPAGYYSCGVAESVGAFLKNEELKTDDLLEFPSSVAEEILKEFSEFWKLKEEFEKRGYLHKRGFLLWGPPASGKTSLIQLMIRHLVKTLDGLVIKVDYPGTATQCLKMLRRVEPDRAIIAIMEDMDALVERHGEAEYLALLDGESQVGNVVFIATTNYPERLDKRFVDRPSRFDTIEYVGMPNATARRIYLKHKEPSLTDAELEEWVSLSNGFSVAHLKEMIISVKCYKKPVHKVVERLDKMRARQPTSSDSMERQVGFGVGDRKYREG